MLPIFLRSNSQKYSNRIRKKASSTRTKKIKKGSCRAVNLVMLSLFALILSGKSSIAQSSLADSTTQLNTFVSSPQKSVHSFIHWQQKGHVIPDRYIQPFALFNGEQADKEQLAQQLLKVLDARGLLVVYSEIPDTPNHIDSLSGLPQYILFNDLPEVYLRKVGSEWLFSESTIEQIPSSIELHFLAL